MDTKQSTLSSISTYVGSPWNTFKGTKITQIRNVLCLVVTSAVLYYLLHLAVWCEYILNIAVAVLAVHLASNLIHYGWEYIFRSTLPDLHSKAVFITGCDTGFGNKLARQLDAKGVTVFAGCLFSEGSNALQLKKECSEKLHIVQLDVTSDEQVKDAVESVTKLLNGKKLHAVVNNAGVITIAETEIMSIETQKRILEVNTFGVSRVTQAFLPLLRESKGRVVIVASLSSHFNLFGFSAYGMSKAAVFAYAETLRTEMLRWDVSVHTIEPFVYRTDMSNHEISMENTKKEWRKAPEIVRRQYGGEEYVKGLEFTSQQLINIFAKTNVNEVTDCLEDAVIGKYPQMRYIPSFTGKLITALFLGIPREVQDLFQNILIPFKGAVEEVNDKLK